MQGRERVERSVGDPGGARTHDPLIKSQMLYQLSYRVKFPQGIGAKAGLPLGYHTTLSRALGLGEKLGTAHVAHF